VRKELLAVNKMCTGLRMVLEESMKSDLMKEGLPFKFKNFCGHM
jgi:hypothetical protein